MKSTFKTIKYLFLFLMAAIFLSACSLLPTTNNAKEDIDPPQENVSYEENLDVPDEEGTTDSEDEEGEAGSVKTELYLIDNNGYVVPRTFFLPVTESVAQQALAHLVDGGPITEQIPNNFRAVLPADTQFTLDVKDGIATVDFSKEFTEYSPEDELKILQSITWTLTQFDAIERVKLQMNGNELKEMPVNGTPINSELSRKIGINIDTKKVADITNTFPLTVYYISKTDEESYYVPITKRISNENENSVATIVDELVKGPDMSSPLYSLFMPDVELLEEPKINKGVVTLNFNENIYGSYEQKLVTNQVLEPLVLSLTEQEGIEAVSIEVNGEVDFVNQDGNPVSEPVTRPEMVNTGSY